MTSRLPAQLRSTYCDQRGGPNLKNSDHSGPARPLDHACEWCVAAAHWVTTMGLLACQVR